MNKRKQVNNNRVVVIRRETPVKTVLHSSYLLKEIKKWIKFINRINSRELIKQRLQRNVSLEELEQCYLGHCVSEPTYHQPLTFLMDNYLYSTLRHPNLMCKTFNQANSVTWLLENGYNYLLRDKIRLNHHLVLEKRWYRYINRTNLSIFNTLELRQLSKLAFNAIDDEKKASDQEKREQKWQLIQHLESVGGESISFLQQCILLENNHLIDKPSEMVLCRMNVQQIVKGYPAGAYIDEYRDKCFNIPRYLSILNHALYNKDGKMIEYLLSLKKDFPRLAYATLRYDRTIPNMNDMVDNLINYGDYKLVEEFWSDIQWDSHLVLPKYTIQRFFSKLIQNITLTTWEDVRVIVSLGSFYTVVPPNSVTLGMVQGRLEQVVNLSQSWIGVNGKGVEIRCDELACILTALETIIKFDIMSNENTYTPFIMKAFIDILSLSPEIKIAEYLKTYICKSVKDGMDLLFHAACQCKYLSTVQHLFPLYQHHINNNLPVTSNLEIYKYLLDRLEYQTFDDICPVLEKAINDGNDQLVDYIINHHLEALPALPIRIFINAFKGCNYNIVYTLLSVYYDGRIIQFNDLHQHDIQSSICNTKTIYFIVRYFNSLKRWFNSLTFGGDDDIIHNHRINNLICNVAIYFNKSVDVVQQLMAIPDRNNRATQLSLYYCLGSSQDNIQQCIKLYQAGYTRSLSADDWEEIGRIGSIDLLDCIISTHQLDPVYSRIMRGAFEGSNYSLIMELTYRYHQSSFTRSNLLVALKNNFFKIVHYYIENYANDIPIEVFTLLIQYFSDLKKIKGKGGDVIGGIGSIQLNQDQQQLLQSLIETKNQKHLNQNRLKQKQQQQQQQLNLIKDNESNEPNEQQQQQLEYSHWRNN